MKRNLIREIVNKTGVQEKGLRVTLSKIKKREDLRSIEQAACYYIKKKGLGINVSSIIDDVTRAALPRREHASFGDSQSRPSHTAKKRVPRFPRVKWLAINYYSLAERLQDFYGELFIFENALRIGVDTVMERDFPNWWESKIKMDLSDVYKYAEDRKAEQSKLPMVGQGQALRPFDYLVSVGKPEK